jgi:hypothetical protein
MPALANAANQFSSAVLGDEDVALARQFEISWSSLSVQTGKRTPVAPTLMWASSGQRRQH